MLDTRTLIGLNINPDTAHAVIDSVIVQQPNKVTVDGSSSTGQLISWDFGDGTQASGANATHTYAQGGAYTVTCIVADTVCNTFDTATYIVNMTIGIDESLLNRSLNVYPNPNSGNFAISFEMEGLQDVEIRIVDAIGREVYFKDLGKVSGAYRQDISLNNEAHGLYVIQILTGDNAVSRKITIQ